MSKHNQQGMTLVEVLAVIIILSFVCLFIVSLMNSTMMQQTEQKNEVQQIQSGAYILKQITKDMRKSYKIVVDSTNENIYYLYNEKNQLLYQYEYTSNSELLRNDFERNSGNSLIGKNINNFSISTDSVGRKATIFFEINGKEYQTTIHFRRGES